MPDNENNDRVWKGQVMATLKNIQAAQESFTRAQEDQRRYCRDTTLCLRERIVRNEGSIADIRLRFKAMLMWAGIIAGGVSATAAVVNLFITR